MSIRGALCFIKQNLCLAINHCNSYATIYTGHIHHAYIILLWLLRLLIFSKPRWRLGNKELSQLWKWADQNPVCYSLQNLWLVLNMQGILNAVLNLVVL